MGLVFQRLVEWLLVSPKIYEFAFSCGTEVIMLHLRTPWFSAKLSEECCATLEAASIEKLIPVHHHGVGSPRHLKAEGCVCGVEGVSCHSADALGGDRT